MSVKKVRAGMNLPEKEHEQSCWWCTGTYTFTLPDAKLKPMPNGAIAETTCPYCQMVNGRMLTERDRPVHKTEK